MIQKFTRGVKAPVEAVQWTGYNPAELEEFCQAKLNGMKELQVPILDGKRSVPCPRGYWVIRHENGYFTICQQTAFRQMFRLLEDK